MFFPNYIAWGVDQSYTSGLVRMARSQIGQPNPVVKKIMDLNTTGFYTCRTDSTNTEWVVCASNEGAQRIDDAIHFYRVADDAATVDEIGSFCSNTAATTPTWAWPVGTPLQARSDGLIAWACGMYQGQGNTGDTEIIGFSFLGRVGWGTNPMQRPNPARRYNQPISLSSGIINLAAGATKEFHKGVIPARFTRIYIINGGAAGWTSGVIGQVEITDTSGNLIAQDLLAPNYLTINAQDLKVSGQNDSAPWVMRSGQLTPGSSFRIRVKNTHGSLTSDITGWIVIAFGQ